METYPWQPSSNVSKLRTLNAEDVGWNHGEEGMARVCVCVCVCVRACVCRETCEVVSGGNVMV